MQESLIIHSLSLMVLGGVRADELEKLLNDVVTRCFSTIFGPRAAKAINSYLNPSLATKDSDEYSSRLRRLAGENSSNVILRKIEDTLCEEIGLEKRDWKNLAECIEAVKSKYAP